MPPNTVSVARPGQWGNPWRVGLDGDAAYCVEQFRRCLTGIAVSAWPKNPADELCAINLPDDGVALAMLRGKNLACWCKPDEPCHADVLLDVANAGIKPSGEATSA